ncbi:M20/M25/M40 family peptidase [Operophtera brumata]|uniref:M20/M25/M40 family peptidase n=1 Tax=Operophtera brumata TaxID=104452 RepID=A0A0L7LTM8_OPEBR|nr:M20/M25/M40 family peptidase [Operophtera brumata]
MQAELHHEHSKQHKGTKKLSRDSSFGHLRAALMSTLSAVETKLQQPSVELHHTQRAKVENSIQMLQVRDISSTPHDQSNLFNIKQMLILLNAKLADKNKFYNSKKGQGFKDIENKKPSQDEPQIKSYSKMEVAVIDSDVKPDLFGAIAGRRKFLLPPNFATVTASRVVLTQLNTSYSKERSDINIKAVSRKNIVVHTYLTQLRERFNDLFAWSYILSNNPPEYYELYAIKPVEKQANMNTLTKRLLPDAPAVTINPRPPKRLRLKGGVDEGIDAVQVDDMSVIDLAPEFNRSNIYSDKTSKI